MEVVETPAREEPRQPVGRRLEPTNIDDVLADVFERSADIYAAGPNQEEAINFMLDLALEKVTAESGSVILSDINEQDLFFGAARGPKAEEVMNYRIPVGQGIVGFCAQEGVGLAISNVKRDPRFYARISEQLGYDTRSILCCPIQSEGRVLGAVELVNKKDGDTFTQAEVGIVTFIAHKTAEYLLTMN